MDNLTHSLVGLALGELTHRLLPAEPAPAGASTRRRLLLTGAALASNFPDLDLVFTSLAPAPLGYLLHHRGHTHTLLYALPQALLLLAALWLCWPGARALLRSSASARRGLAAATLLGLLLHFGMDALNVYGIHPFAPFDPRWYYGESFQTPQRYTSVPIRGRTVDITLVVIFTLTVARDTLVLLIGETWRFGGEG